MSIVKFKDIETMKTLLADMLKDAGMEKQLEVINSTDLENILTVLMNVEQIIRRYDDEQDKISYLEKYIACLLCILSVDYGVNVKEL